MPIPRSQKEPTSSVANMLTSGIGASLMSKAPPITEVEPLTPKIIALPERVPAGIIGEPADIKLQFTLTKSTEKVLEELASSYRDACGMKPSRSELLRAILKALRCGMNELKREATHIGRLKRPKKEKGQESQDRVAKMEDKIVYAIIAGMRACELPEADSDS